MSARMHRAWRARLRRAGALAAAGVLLALPLAAAAPAADRRDAEEIRVRKVVDAVVDADGEVTDARLFTALEVTGEGEVEVSDPTSLERLRRLDGLGAPARRADAAVWRLRPDPTAAVRTVADHDRPLPVTMQARYRVDGVTVDTGGFASTEGEADLRFAVRNLTARPVELEWPTADGTVSGTVDVPIPMVARLRAVFGPGWRGLDAPEAAIATDGEGNTIVEWTTVLFPPLGPTDAALAVTADESGTAAPEVTLEAAPVGTERDRPLADATALLRDASSDAAVLAFAFGELGDGVGELADGVGELADGIAALADGAGGLAEGVGEAAGGAGELADGVAGLAGGAAELAGGAEGLAGGAGELAGGTQELAGGLGQLAEAGEGLAGGAGELAAGLAELDAGVGELAGGAAELATAAEGVAAGTRALADALGEVTDTLPGPLPTDDIEQRLAVLVGSLERLGERVGDAAAVVGVLEATQARIDELAQRAASVEDPELREALLVTAAELGGLVGDAQERAAGLLAAVGEEVSEATEALAGIGELLGGLPDAAPGPTGEVDALADGAEAVAAGVDGLAAALAGLADGTGEAAAGAQQLAGGAGGLAAGAGEAAGGAAALAEGTGGLADASAGLAGGARGLAAGADAAAGGTAGLAEGLEEAAGGASQLAEGAGEAAEGTEALGEGAAGLADGADRVSDAADDASADAARDVALLRAGQRRADEDGVPYGAPEGARARAAYRLTLAEPESDAPFDVRWLLLGGLLGAAALLPGLARRR